MTSCSMDEHVVSMTASSWRDPVHCELIGLTSIWSPIWSTSFEASFLARSPCSFRFWLSQCLSLGYSMLKYVIVFLCLYVIVLSCLVILNVCHWSVSDSSSSP